PYTTLFRSLLGVGVRGAAGGHRVVESLASAVEPLLAAAGEHLPALPQRDRVLEASLSGLQAPHHLDQLIARRLVGQLRDVGRQRLLALHGGDGRGVRGIALGGAGGRVGAGAHQDSSDEVVGSEGVVGSVVRAGSAAPDGPAGPSPSAATGALGAVGCAGGWYGSAVVRSTPKRPPATRTDSGWPTVDCSGSRTMVPSASWTTA